MSNMQLAANSIQALLDFGVQEFCLCAGARNSPLIHLFDQNPQIRVYHFFEERSAAFFAIGRMLESTNPVAVVTTSGTAAAELLPAAVEANYSALPLVMITADRPKSYRGSGAPQSIEQIGIFSHYVGLSLDIDSQSNLNWTSELKNFNWKKPLHLNLCFEEPLIDGDCDQLKTANEPIVKSIVDVGSIQSAQEFLNKFTPVVILGQLPIANQKSVISFIKKLGVPVYAEAISGLRGHPDIDDLEIVSGEKGLQKLFEQKIVNSVIRIGGVPTVRLWRDLEGKLKYIPVLSIAQNEYSGLSRETLHLSSLQVLENFKTEKKQLVSSETFFAEDKSQEKKLKILLEKYPQSEPGLIYQLSQLIKANSVYLGNSLPIREWDFFAVRNIQPERVAANRGANGIDGQLSTFFGWCQADKENWGIFGDLTTMYDLSAPWIANQTQKSKKRIVIINNGGGMIFNRMFKKDIFLNRHQTDFSAWAKMWKWEYSLWKNIPKDEQLSDQQIIEINPSPEETNLFWSELDQLS